MIRERKINRYHSRFVKDSALNIEKASVEIEREEIPKRHTSGIKNVLKSIKLEDMKKSGIESQEVGAENTSKTA